MSFASHIDAFGRALVVIRTEEYILCAIGEVDKITYQRSIHEDHMDSIFGRRALQYDPEELKYPKMDFQLTRARYFITTSVPRDFDEAERMYQSARAIDIAQAGLLIERQQKMLPPGREEP